MSVNDLNIARKNSKDEFFTQLEDISLELQYYKDDLKDKIVYCNCDNPYESNFVKYFIENFQTLSLKELLVSGFVKNGLGYYLYVNESNILNWKENICFLNGDGDFRSDECIDILNKSDIIITNPPFSLFREYVDLLTKFKKKFLIIGNINAVTYKNIFPLIKENKVWLGYSIHSGDRKFKVPSDYPLETKGVEIDELGNLFIKVKGVRWFTNIGKRENIPLLLLTKQYSIEKYSFFDNYMGLNVNKTSEIPKDYMGIIGVPITFLDKYNPNQFEILGLTGRNISNEFKTKIYDKKDYKNANDLNGSACIIENNVIKMVYKRLLIKRLL